MRNGLVIALVFVFAAAAAPASATLVYEKGTATGKPSVWVANDDGSGARRVAARGRGPRISRDGQTIVYSTLYTQRSRPRLMAVPAVGGPARVLLDPVWDSGAFAWSPDSKTIAALTGPEVGTKRLELIDVATANRRTVATGQFAGVSFSPAGDAIVYSRQPRDDYPQHADLFTALVTGGQPTQITHDRHSVWPLWGPQRIVFARERKPPRRGDNYKQDLYTMTPTGGDVRRLTRIKIGFLLDGLSPTAWSADGTRLLAEFGGQDTSYAETVDPATGRVRVVGRAVEQGIIGTDLSGDGTTILADTGGYDPGGRHDVVAIPYAGGTPRVLVRNAFNPDWNL